VQPISSSYFVLNADDDDDDDDVDAGDDLGLLKDLPEIYVRFDPLRLSLQLPPRSF
jgi:hypothetical protein